GSLLEADDEVLDHGQILTGDQPHFLRSARQWKRALIRRDQPSESPCQIRALVLAILYRQNVRQLELVVEKDVLLVWMFRGDRGQIIVHTGPGEDDAPGAAVRGRFEVLSPKLRIAGRSLEELDPHPFFLGFAETRSRRVVEALVTEVVAHDIDRAERIGG